MSQFIHHVWEKLLLFMLISVRHDKRSFSLQININRDITSIVQWVKDFSMPSFFVYYNCLLHFDSFTILVLTGNTQLAIACLGWVILMLVQRSERHYWFCAGVFIVSFEHGWCIFLLLTWGKLIGWLGISNFNNKISFN